MYDQQKTIKEIQKLIDENYLKAIENQKSSINKPYINVYMPNFSHLSKKITVHNDKAGRSYQRHLENGKIKRHTNFYNELDGSYHNTNNTWLYIIVGLIIVACGAIYYFTYGKETNDGCIASAYQATKYGHDLEANLQV